MAPPVMTIDGDVVAVHSRWTADGSRIVTEATVRTPDGAEVVVSQLGGTVDGIGMRVIPAPEMLVPGMKVSVAAHRDVDLAQQTHVVLDSAKVRAYPSGFVRTGPTDAGKYLYWKSGCVYITLDTPGTTAIPGDQEFTVIDESIATWNSGTASCSYLTLVNAGRASSEVGRDKLNLIKFRDTTWGRPKLGDDPARSYEPMAAAITTAIYINDPKSDRDGEILDADIELNGVNFSITVNPQPTDGRNAVLQNTLTHELGHLQGLEHPCRASSTEPQRVDNLGDPVPLCDGSSDPPRIREATMYNFAAPGETLKETLSDDDIAAICAIYPTADDPGTCDEVGSTSGGCCSASGTGDRPDASLLLAGATLLFVMRRRKTSPNA
jgi:MYXO-CTERM domain-containing protein